MKTEETVMSPAALLANLSEMVGEKIAKNSEGPKTPRAFSGRLTRITTAVRKMGVEITRPKMTDPDSRHAYRR